MNEEAAGKAVTYKVTLKKILATRLSRLTDVLFDEPYSSAEAKRIACVSIFFINTTTYEKFKKISPSPKRFIMSSLSVNVIDLIVTMSFYRECLTKPNFYLEFLSIALALFKLTRHLSRFGIEISKLCPGFSCCNTAGNSQQQILTVHCEINVETCRFFQNEKGRYIRKASLKMEIYPINLKCIFGDLRTMSLVPACTAIYNTFVMMPENN
ncbi:hypothetical protein ALC53_02419 [Atta colombica]|uniref:Uncharacterized protein n=1 Tax=Atta colombica TaxID=520822 RepID=A0A195BR31_9HYME|nr:hypothetical protein ALC53_02419 [Atta colombica]